MSEAVRKTNSTVRLLHVDDEPDFADLTASFLERENDRFEVETATGAEDGLNRLSDEEFDCIVSDYDMPGQNGIEFLETVRENHPELPFILYTGKGSEEVASDAISAGVTDYLQKESGTGQYTVLANRVRNAVERYRAEQDRQRQQEAIETAREGISILNSDCEFIYVNQIYADLYGYEIEEMVGEHWELIYSDDEVDFVRDKLLPTVADEGYWHGETTGTRADGTTFPGDLIISQTSQEELVCTVRDLSTQRERETELRLKTRAMDAAPVGITITGSGDDDNPVIYFNDRFGEVTGYDREEIIGQDLRFLQGEATDEEPVAELRDAIDADEPVTVELRNYRKDGAEFWNRVSIAPVRNDAGEVTNYVGFQQDVTEPKERQQQLETVEKYRRDIYRITSATEMTPDEKIQRLLTLGCEFLGLENGHIVAIDPNKAHHEIQYAAGSNLVEAGTVSDLSETYCRRTIEADDILSIANAPAEGYADDPAYEQWGISCYVGAKLTIEDELFGTLCFADRGGQTSLTGPEKAMVDLMARWISHALERKQSRRERERIFDRMVDGVFALDNDWHLQYANDHGRELLGDMLDEPGASDGVIGTHIWEAIPEIQGTAFYETCQEAMRGQELTTSQWYSDQLDRWFDIRAYPDEVGLSVYFQDITEERQREDRIEAHKQTLQEIYDEIADADQSFESRVERLIEIGRRVTGAEYGSLSRVRGDEYTFEVVHAPDGTIQAGDVVDLKATNCERAIFDEETLVLSDIAAEAPELMEKPGYAEWGVSCYVGTPVVVEDEVYGTFCFYDTDPHREPFSEWEVTVVDLIGKWIGYELTRERTAERLRTQNERLEEFASIVSHDLRNPLRVADGQATLLGEEHESEHLDAINRSLSRMEELIDDLLTLARGDEQSHASKRVNFGNLVRTCWQNVETAETELIVDCDRVILGNSSRLQQLVENLIRNAVEHGGDTVTITVGELDDGFYIEDDGSGIPPKKRDDVFEAGHSTSEAGTGFGLSIVEQVAEAHGWNIGVSEGSKGGARFEFTGVEFSEG